MRSMAVRLRSKYPPMDSAFANIVSSRPYHTPLFSVLSSTASIALFRLIHSSRKATWSCV